MLATFSTDSPSSPRLLWLHAPSAYLLKLTQKSKMAPTETRRRVRQLPREDSCRARLPAGSGGGSWEPMRSVIETDTVFDWEGLYWQSDECEMWTHRYSRFCGSSTLKIPPDHSIKQLAATDDSRTECRHPASILRSPGRPGPGNSPRAAPCQ